VRWYASSHYALPRSFGRVGQIVPQMPAVAGQGGRGGQRGRAASHGFTLVRMLFPGEWVRPPPDAWTVVAGVLKDLRFFVPAGESVLTPAVAEPGPRDIMLMLPVRRVAPADDRDI
jgi:hypothetical protein